METGAEGENHPIRIGTSGDSEPTDQDIEIAKRLDLTGLETRLR